MRYIIETLTHAQSWTIKLKKAEENGEIRIIEHGNPIEIIKEDVKKISKAFNTVKESGIDKDIMISYIKSKGITLKQINEVLYYQTEFFKKLGALK